jgi:phospholipase D1/2
MQTILKPGKNCWCLEPAERISFLVDGQAIFEAFEAVAGQAKKSLLIVGWDIDSRVRLRRPVSPGGDAESTTLGAFLENLVEPREGLEIHILIWDFPVIYASDREPLPVFNLDWKTHRRIYLALDGEHPIGGCHHQKIVVVDDQLAMVGGFDLTHRRWDTPAHFPVDPRRKDPLGKPYPPFHDVQMLVKGPVAGKLGDLARERWYRATAQRLSKPVATEMPVWPSSVSADLKNIPVAVARTEPAFKNRSEIKEVQRLYQEAIAAAERYILIENQYLTSKLIMEALLTRLREKNGPELVIILPKSNSGWLEESTMGRLRSGVLQGLWDGDRHGHLGIYCPVINDPGPAGQTELRVHSKIMIIDDTFVRVGSANLNNRSMGFDTECDLAVEIPANNAADNGIVMLRNRLLAEHLETTPDLVGETIGLHGSLLRAIEILSGKVHTLEVLGKKTEHSEIAELHEIKLIDPEEPVQLDRMMDQMLINEAAQSISSRTIKIKLAITVLIFAALIALWRFTPLRAYTEIGTLVAATRSLSRSHLSWLYVLLGYLIGGSLCFPVTAMIVATSILFSPLAAICLSLGGSIASAVLTFALGHWLGRDTIRTFAGGRLNKISKVIARKGLIAVGALRLVPIAPFTLINLVAGASHIRFRDYLLGTLCGMLPGIVGLTLLTDRIKAALLEPGFWNGFLLVLAILAVGLGGCYLKRRLSKPD